MVARSTPENLQPLQPVYYHSSSASNFLITGLVIALVVVAFMVGALWQKVTLLEKGGVNLAGAVVPTTAPAAAVVDPTKPVKADTLNLAPASDKDHVRGDENAKLTWIEYSDLQCPYCKLIHPSLQKLISDYNGQIKWIYRHFPLSSIHPRANAAANAAECVAAAGGDAAFWKFVDEILSASDQSVALTDVALANTAASVGVNKSAFNICFKAEKYKQNVTDSYDSGAKAGVNGTPGSFLLDGNGNVWVISGALPYDSLKNIVEIALKTS